ncbi:MAG: hypothetical protein ABIK11_04495 [candidate division WOR-3 bacterium]
MLRMSLLWILVSAGLMSADQPASQNSALLGTKDGVPLYINYQGYLTDASGNPVSATLSMLFEIYDAETGGNRLWWQTHSSVLVQQGVFNVKLQLQESDTTIFRLGERRWLQLTVSGVRLSPRTEITSMAYGIHSAKADNADQLDGRHADEFIFNSTTLQPNANFWISGSGIAGGQLRASAIGIANGPAIYGTNANGSNFGVWGHNTNVSGTGVAGSGNNDTLFYLINGSGGAFSARRFGLFAYAHDTNGTGIATMGNRITDTVWTLAAGCGGAFNGTRFGVYGLARNLSGERCGGFFRTYGTDSVKAYIAYNYGGTRYGILSDGTKSTVMTTSFGPRVLFCPEAPQPFFEDFGEAQLVNGHCRVNLDPVFLDCITVDKDHPLRVFVTLTDDCNGVYVKADETGFDVYELNNGRSSAGFYYRVIGLRRGSESLRFPAAPAAPPAQAVPLKVEMSTEASPER